jgi:hypothetical protein
LFKLLSKKKSPYLVVSESRMMAQGDNKEFFMPDMSDLQATTTEDEDAPLESQYKSKDFVKTEKNEMLFRRSSSKYLPPPVPASDPLPEPEPEPE